MATKSAERTLVHGAANGSNEPIPSNAAQRTNGCFLGMREM